GRENRERQRDRPNGRARTGLRSRVRRRTGIRLHARRGRFLLPRLPGVDGDAHPLGMEPEPGCHRKHDREVHDSAQWTDYWRRRDRLGGRRGGEGGVARPARPGRGGLWQRKNPPRRSLINSPIRRSAFTSTLNTDDEETWSLRRHRLRERVGAAADVAAAAAA